MDLFILVEGTDDRNFFISQLINRLTTSYDEITIWRYAEQTASIRRKIIDGINAAGDDYIYVADLDEMACVGARKEAIQRTIPAIDLDRIAVVCRCIDGWYLAGLTTSAQRQARIDVGRIPNLTDECDK